MKKLIIAMLALVMCVSLAACGRRNQDTETTQPTTPPSNEMPTTPNPDPLPENNIPDQMPEANIPDPDVDTQMPIYDDGNNTTDHSTNSRSGH